MALHRSAAGAAVTALVLLAPQVWAGQASAAPTTERAATAAVTAYASSPCVHRGITFFCGSVQRYDPVATTRLEFDFGDPTDRPLFGDWNGDGNRTAAVFRPATATWYLTNTDDASDPPQVLAYGNPGDIPLSGNWDGGGTETVGVYRPSNATFYLRYANNTTGTADVSIPFGNRGDIPLAGNFDLTGTTRIGVYRPMNQTFYFSHAPGSPYGPVTSAVYGNPGDRPLAASYKCTGTSGELLKFYGVFRPSNITWYGLCAGSPHQPVSQEFQYGDPTDLPLLK